MSRHHEAPDWRDIVTRRLHELHLPGESEAKVADELAQLLEDASTDVDLRSPEAVERYVADQVEEWGGLAELLQRRRPAPPPQRFSAPAVGAGPVALAHEHVRYALRRMRHRPGFTTLAVLSLALGIGANVALFSFVESLVLRPLDVHAPEELVNVYMRTPEAPYFGFSNPDYEDLAAATEEVFAGVAASRFVVGQADRNGSLETLTGEAVTGNLFRLLGVEMELGRPLLARDDVAPGAHPVVVLGFEFWRDVLGGDPQIVGKTLRLAQQPFEIVGVAPESYGSSARGVAVDFFAPRMMADVIEGAADDRLDRRDSHGNAVVARLREGVGDAQVEGVLQGAAAQIGEQAPEHWHPQTSFVTVPKTDVLLSPRVDSWVRATSALLLGVVGLVLLMACANLAGFLLAQAVDRRPEISLRMALGASRGRLVGQLIVESMVLAAFGGIAGVGIGAVMLRALERVELPLPVQPELGLGLDLPVLGYALAATLVAGLALGLVPALQGSRVSVATTLRGQRTGSGRGWVRQALISSQVAVSLLLLVSAGLFLRSYQQRLSGDPGFGSRPAAVMTMLVPATRFDEVEGRRYVDGLLDRFRAVPGVEEVGLASPLPLDFLRSSRLGFNLPGVEPPPGSDAHTADFAVVDAGYFGAAGIRIEEGRPFDEGDRADAPAVAIVSRELADRYFAGESALAQRMSLDTGDVQVVGVAEDVNVRSLGEEPIPYLYLPYSQRYTSFVRIVARTTRDPEVVGVELASAGRQLDPDFWAWELTTMERHIGLVALPARVSALLLSLFAAVAISLAVLGLYGIVSHSVRQRSREIGIRLSLGASPRAVLRLAMATGMRAVLIGSGVGLALAVLASGLVRGLLFRTSAFDLWAFAGAVGVLCLASVAATWIPARRALRVSPAKTLRME